jgi:Fanconi anemia group M protein
MECQKPLIILDERERHTIRDCFMKVPCVLQIETLPVADYLIAEDFGLERKRGDDLVASICDNRFFRQLYELHVNYARTALILESPKKMFNGRKINPASIYGALVYVAYKLHIPIIPTESEFESAQLIWSLAKFAQKKQAFHYKPREIAKYDNEQEWQKAFLQGLCDVGEKRAEMLLTTFETPYKVITNILQSGIIYSKTGKPQEIIGPLKQLSGFGVKFLQANLQLLTKP